MAKQQDVKREKGERASEVILQNEVGPLTVIPTGLPGLTAVVPYSTKQLMEMSEDTPLTMCPHNIDLENADGRALLMNMAGKGHMEIAEGRPVKMRFRHYLIYPDILPDEETGEIHPILRTILADGNGRIVSSTSASLPKRLKQILAGCPFALYPDGVPIELVRRPSKKPGRSYHDIRVLGPNEECP